MKKRLFGLIILVVCVIGAVRVVRQSAPEQIVEQTFNADIEKSKSTPSQNMTGGSVEVTSVKSNTTQAHSEMIEFKPEADVTVAADNYAKYCSAIDQLFKQYKFNEEKLSLLRKKILESKQNAEEDTEFTQLYQVSVQLRTVLTLCISDELRKAEQT